MRSSIRLEKNVEVAMRDGVVLRADVWRPDDDGRYPAVVERTPYQKERSTGHDFLRPDVMAAAGYAMVIQDTRGRFASDGEFQGIQWDREARDGYDTVEWAAGQSWCDGNVGMWGASYPGTVTWLTALERPPHLKAIAPAMTADAETAPEAAGGGFLLELLTNWLIMQIASDVVPKQVAAGTVTPDTIAKVTRAVREPAVLTEYLPLKSNPYLDIPGCPLTLEQLISGASDGPTPRDFDWERLDLPTLLVTGWFDPFASIDQHRLVTERGGGGQAVRSAHRLVVGPWVHSNQLSAVQGEINFGLDAVGRPMLGPLYQSFFDHHLKGRGADFGPVRYFLMGANEWRDAGEWPPEGAIDRVWYLSSAPGSGGATPSYGTRTPAGALLSDPPVADGCDQFHYDPMDPVRTHGGRAVPIGRTVAGPLNQQHLEGRADVVCYTSGELRSSVDVVGPVKVRLFASSSAPDTDFVAKLIDVFPDGRSILVCNGMRRGRYHAGFTSEGFVESGAVNEYEIQLGHTAWRFEPGHRLRVHVTSSNFPHVDRNMNTGNAIGEDSTGCVAEQVVHHGPTWPSRLEVHVLPPAAGVASADGTG